jgi:hypothetical protein
MSLLQMFKPARQIWNEQRRSIREPVNFPAWISRSPGGSPIPCIILDVSEHGARIEISQMIEVPESFYLILARTGSRKRLCRIAWRTDDQIGICYLGPIVDDSVKIGRFTAVA